MGLTKPSFSDSESEVVAALDLIEETNDNYDSDHSELEKNLGRRLRCSRN